MPAKEKQWGLTDSEHLYGSDRPKAEVAIQPPCPQPEPPKTFEQVLEEARQHHSSVSVEHWADLVKLLGEFQSVVSLSQSDFGCTDRIQHEIQLTDPNRSFHRVYPVSHKNQEEFMQQIDDMIRKEVIEPCESPWASPVVLPKKKDGTLRVCIDFRFLNSLTIDDPYPIPRIDEMFDKLAGSKYFTSLDLTSGYWQIPLRPEHRFLTAFLCPRGQYQFRVMPFGLKNAPATFQRLMDRLLKGANQADLKCMVYLDDIIIYSATWAEHLQQLRRIFKILSDAGLKIKLKKCDFAQKQLVFLGHTISAKGITPNEENVRALQEMPIPKTKEGVRSFLGGAGYYRKFIPDFAQRSYALRALTSKNSQFRWTAAHGKEFSDLVNALKNPPVLAYPDFKKPFHLTTDASRKGLGAVLSQKAEDGQLHPIIYISRALTKHEEAYGSTHKEATAVVWAVERLSYYLKGYPFTIVSDHKALQYLFAPDGRLDNKPDKMKRWGSKATTIRLYLRISSWSYDRKR